MYNTPSKLARFSLRGSSRTVLHCAHRASDFPALYPYPARRLVWSPLRASNEGLLRPRVARAQRPCQLSRHSPSKLARFSLTGCRKSRSSHPPDPGGYFTRPPCGRQDSLFAQGHTCPHAAFSHRSDPQRTKEILGGRKPWRGFSVRQDPVELSRPTSLQVLNQAIRTEDCTCPVAFQDRYRIAIAP